MADPWSATFVAIPCAAVIALAAYAVRRRGERALFRGRGADVFTLALVIIAAGSASTTYGVAFDAPSADFYGGLLTAAGTVPAVIGVLLLLKQHEVDRVDRDRLDRLATSTSAQVEAIVRAAEAT